VKELENVPPARERVERALAESIRVKQELLATSAQAIAKAGCLVADALEGGAKVLLFGNGGSASDAQHIAAEWVGRYVSERRAMPAIALTANSSELTAISNDYGFEQVFVRGIEAHGAAGDVAIALSTSGSSANVLAAVTAARARGLHTIGLTGKGGGELAAMVDIAVRVPSDETPRIQESHIAICHAICEVVEDRVFGGAVPQKASR
jgi:D-sedoheptulose 7-phosphate isomerase